MGLSAMTARVTATEEKGPIMKKLLFVLILAGAAIGGYFYLTGQPGQGGGGNDPALATISTDFGDIVVRLYDDTPQHKDNFVKLANDGFYDGLLFHRVVEGFIIQGGDPDSRNAEANYTLGQGGPGYTIPAEITPQYIHKRGALAAARLPDRNNPLKNSSGSQFYIVHGQNVSDVQLDTALSRKQNLGLTYTAEQRDIYKSVGGTPFLDADYTVFGEVIEGMDIVDTIASKTTNRSNRPVDDIKMTVKIGR